MSARYTYAHLIELVDGDRELIAHLVEYGVIERRGEDRALVDVDVVLAARTLWRDLELEWPAIEVVLHLRGELARARERVVELEAALGRRQGG